MLSRFAFSSFSPPQPKCPVIPNFPNVLLVSFVRQTGLLGKPFRRLQARDTGGWTLKMLGCHVQRQWIVNGRPLCSLGFARGPYRHCLFPRASHVLRLCDGGRSTSRVRCLALPLLVADLSMLMSSRSGTLHEPLHLSWPPEVDHLGEVALSSCDYVKH